MRVHFLFVTVATILLHFVSLEAINRPIHGIVTDGVTVTCDQEGMMLFREQKHGVAMKNLSRSLARTCDFQVIVSNHSEEPLRLTHDAVHVADQTGRVLEVVTKETLIASLRDQHRQRLTNQKKKYTRERDLAAAALEEATAERILMEKGELPNVEGDKAELLLKIQETLKRERELRYALEDLPYINEKKREELQIRHQEEIKNATENYLEDRNILPGKAYRATFQISLPRNHLKEMRYITVTYDLDGEEYPFTYQIEQRHIRNK